MKIVLTAFLLFFSSWSIQAQIETQETIETAEASVGEVRVIKVGGLDGDNQQSSDATYEIGLALSGGGARGLSAIGILKAFEERNIKVIAITGTSIGGIVGSLYACGYSPAQMDSIITNLSFASLFSNRPERKTMLLTQREARERHLLAIRFDGFKPEIPSGLTAAQELSSQMTRLTATQNYFADADFEKLPIPFRTVSTDVVTGEKILLTSGSLADAIRSTIAFPLAFTGVDRGDQLLMDGGMVTPVPVRDLKDMLPENTFVVAVNSTSPLLPKEELNNPVVIANQVTTIMTNDRLIAELAQADLVMRPELGEGDMTDVDQADQFIEIGYQAGLVAADSIIGLLKERKDEELLAIKDFGSVATNYPILLDDTSGVAYDFGNRLDWNQTSYRQLLTNLKQVARDRDLFEIELRIEKLPFDSLTIDSSVIPITTLLDWRDNPHKRFSSLEFKGNYSFSASVLRELFPIDNESFNPGEFLDSGVEIDGEIIRREEIKESLDRLIQFYRDRHYDLMQVRSAKLDYHQDRLDIVIDEGIIHRIDVEGNEISRDWLIRSYFPLHVGQPYSSKKSNQGLSNIYGSDLFDRVTVDLTPSDEGVIVTIRVKEKKYTQVRLGWHWHNIYQSEEFIELLNDNLFGTGTEYLLHTKVGYDRQNYYIQARANRIFSTYLTGRFRLYYDQLERNVYDGALELIGQRDEHRWGAEFKIGQHISRLGTVSAKLVVEEFEYEEDYLDRKERFGQRSLIFESHVETFDRATFPESGKQHLFELSFAGKTQGGTIEVFTKFYNTIESYFPLGHGLNYHPRFVLGFSRTGLPASEKFFLGGMRSFSGYKTNQKTGDKIFALNQELRLKIPWRFYLTARYDFGEVYGSTDQVKLSELKQGWGGSIAFDSPVGPFEFGYGKVSKGPERFYFNAGFEF